MKRIIQISALVMAFFLVSYGQEKQTENTLKLSEGKNPAAGSIGDIAWVAGAWRGEGFGGIAEDVYTKPEDGVILGMCRVMAKGKAIFYELITISEDSGSLTVKLKHFNPDLTGWEEKDKSQAFRLVKKDGKRLYFEGMTFELKSKHELVIYVAISGKDGPIREEAFNYRRTKLH